MIKIYGIKNCDTVKKALSFCDSKKISYQFIDMKKQTPSKEIILSWKKQLGHWPVNPSGRIFKLYSEQFSEASDDAKVELIIDQTSLLKRPILEIRGQIKALGFIESQWHEELQEA